MPRRLDTGRPRWDDAAQGGAAVGERLPEKYPFGGTARGVLSDYAACGGIGRPVHGLRRRHRRRSRQRRTVLTRPSTPWSRVLPGALIAALLSMSMGLAFVGPVEAAP